jgi:hypothetical protein
MLALSQGLTSTLAWYANVTIPQADTDALRDTADLLNRLALKIFGKLKADVHSAVTELLSTNNSPSLQELAKLEPNQLTPHFDAIGKILSELRDGLVKYAAAVDDYKTQLWHIGTQLLATLHTMNFGFISPTLKAAGEAVIKWLVKLAQIRKSIFQKIVHAIISTKLGMGALKEVILTASDSIGWGVTKSSVHMISALLPGQTMGNFWDYGFAHIIAEAGYDVGIDGLRAAGQRLARLLPGSTLPDFAAKLFGDGPLGRTFRKTVSAGVIYQGIINLANGRQFFFNNLQALLAAFGAHSIRAYGLNK